MGACVWFALRRDGGFGLELFRASERQIQIQNVQGLCTRDPAFRQMDFTYINRLFLIDQLRPFLPRGGRAAGVVGRLWHFRSIADLTSGFALQLSNSVIFPFIARHSEVPRAELRNEVTSIRQTLLLIAALGFSVAAAFVDLAIHIVFDQRYHAAGWMAPLLIIGGWFSILCSLNKSTLLGLGAPRYGAIAYSVKFLWLLVGLPLGINKFGPVGGIIAIAVSDIFRYPAVFFGQIQQRFAFGWQDLFATLLMLVLFAIFVWLRWMLGLGTPFDSVFS